jgi:bifunctional DNA-binding transcriptional regulator/antitoxin component of YhaV-PrlF toxin-antitoxin module
MTDLVKMSEKGQLVVPQSIRDLGKFKTGDRFIPYPVERGVVFRKVEIPELKADFGRLSGEISRKFREKGITPKDVDEAVEWARQK